MKKSMEWVSEHVSDFDAQKAVIYTQRLIRGKSYNPPGDETKVAAFAAGILEEAGFTVTLDEFEQKRCNVMATYGNADDIALILNGHLDVVPAFGEWERSPSAAECEDGILYGRGSCDMLGGCGAILAAAKIIGSKMHSVNRGVMVLFVSDEEDMNLGMRHILKEKNLKAECAVIAEPTGCEIHLGNRGFSSFFIRTTGVGCHSGEPWNGVNAIYKMGEVIRRIEAYAEGLKEVTSEYLGRATTCIGTIKGGIRLNTVPDSCEIEIERRLLPGETQESIHLELQEAIGEHGEVIDRSFFHASLIEKEHPLVQNCAAGLKEIAQEGAVISVFRACTEASMFSVLSGIPTILLGPGSLEQAHRVNEFCRVSDILTCARLFTGLMHHYLL